MTRKATRRDLLKGAALSGVSYFLTGSTKSLAEENASKSPNEKMNVAVIGIGGRSRGILNEGVKAENIVALCDVDENRGKATFNEYPKAKKFRDFRNMFDAMHKEIDGVVVCTPDHSHCIPAVTAMRLGKHCYCEKPLGNTVWESRMMTEAAKENKVATQMGTQIHSLDNYRRVVEKIQAGAIGPVREVHVYSGAKYRGTLPTEFPPAPEGLDWDRWIGPAQYRPYSNKICPFAWRGFWDYGSGGLGDFGCHYGDLAFWALNLKYPLTCEAEGPEVDPVVTSIGLTVRYTFPARGDMPALKYTWYDGDERPELIKQGKVDNWGSGVLFIGDKGMLHSNYSKHVLLPEEKFADYQAPEPTIPKSIGHQKEWIVACKTGSPTTCNFDYSGALTETVMLGKAAYRSGKKIDWDPVNLKAKGCPEADQYLRPNWRPGWSI